MTLIEALQSCDGLHRGEQSKLLLPRRKAIIKALEQARLCAELLLHDNDFRHPEAEKLLDLLDKK